jgi:flagellin-specific chaperone FliS
MSLEIFQEFATLPKIEKLISVLVKIQQTYYENIITEYNTVRCTIILINGYIERHREVQLFIEAENIERFRDWIGTQVSQYIRSGQL